METGAQEPLRVRITTARDVTEPLQTIGVAADIDEACEIIRSWLEQFADGAERSGDSRVRPARG